MEMNAVLFAIVGVIGFAFLFAYILRIYNIPAAVAYIITGIVVGPSALEFVHDRELLNHLGELGVIMLMFFIGMEVSLPRLIAKWRVAVLGTAAQMALSVGICCLVAWLLGWSWQSGLLFGFIISMSSTAVVLTLLKDANELETPFGQNALGVLLVQDLAIVPIMIILGAMGEHDMSGNEIAIQLVGGIALMGLVIWLLRHPGWHIPETFLKSVDKQIMMGLLLCFAAAALTAWIGLSAPFGAFLAGMILKSSDQSEWVEEHLHSLYVVFVAIFFLSVGMLVDLHFVMEHIGVVILMTLGVFILNSGINTLVLRVLGETWTMSLLTGGLLSQIGELSFLLASLGLAMGMLTVDGHQMAIVVIAFSLMLSPLWMVAVRLLIHEDTQMMADKGLDEEIRVMAKQLEQTRSHD